MPTNKTTVAIAANGIVALLITGGTYFISQPGCGNFPDALCTGGWPLVYRRVGGILGFNDWYWFNLLLDLVFWFIVSTTLFLLLARLKHRATTS